MEYKIERLKPGTRYIMQIRTLGEDETSEWSPAFYVTIPSDDTIPDYISGLTGSYLNGNFRWTWSAVPKNMDGTKFTDFRGYYVEITDGTNTYSTLTVNRYIVVDRQLFLANFSGDTLTCKVKAQDTTGNQSPDFVTYDVTAPSPGTVGGFTASGTTGGINLRWTAITSPEIQEYEIYEGGSSGFTPDTSTFTNLAGTSAGNTFTWSATTASATPRYFKIRAKSIYGGYSASFASANSTSIAASTDTSIATALTVKDEGTNISTSVNSIDFTGAGVTVSGSGAAVTVSISSTGGGGGGGGTGTYSADIGDGTATSFTVTHGLATKDVHVTIYENASPYEEINATVTHTTTNSITVTFSTPPSTNQYRVVIGNGPGSVSGSGGASGMDDITLFNGVYGSSPTTFDYEFESVSTSLPSGWSWVNQGTSTYKEQFGAGIIVPQFSTGDNVRMITRSMSSFPSTWQVFAKMSYSGPGNNNIMNGLAVRESSSGKFVTWTAINASVESWKWNSPTSSNSSYANATGVYGFSQPYYMSIKKNSSTSYDLLYSMDGVTWRTHRTAIDFSTFLSTPDEIAFIAGNSDNSSSEHAIHWFRVR